MFEGGEFTERWKGGEVDAVDVYVKCSEMPDDLASEIETGEVEFDIV